MGFLTPEKMHCVGQHPIDVPAVARVIGIDLVLERLEESFDRFRLVDDLDGHSRSVVSVRETLLYCVSRAGQDAPPFATPIRRWK